MPIKSIITSGTTADCTQAAALIDGLEAAYLLADRGYDTNALIDTAHALGMEPVIPSKRNRKEQRDHDRGLYRARHLVENAFLHLKQWRGIRQKHRLVCSHSADPLRIHVGLNFMTTPPSEWYLMVSHPMIANRLLHHSLKGESMRTLVQTDQ